MQNINALSLTANVNDWLTNSSHARILHVFDHACNLINERREVLSIVTRQIGNGPFNLVAEDDILFSDYLHLQSPISISPHQLCIGDFVIQTADAKLWNPRPDWEELHRQKEHVIELIISSPITQSLVSNLTSALANADTSSALTLTDKLAGLGIGLTPAGDDFLMGALYASWIIHPLEIATVLATEIANTAAPLTTSLSAAWLRSAGRGEAGILWHNLFNSLLLPVPNLESPVSQILSVGETSGADALAGFLGTLISYAKVHTKPCPS